MQVFIFVATNGSMTRTGTKIRKAVSFNEGSKNPISTVTVYTDTLRVWLKYVRGGTVS